MFTLWILFFIASAQCQDAETSTSKQLTANVTILYPTNKTLLKNTSTDHQLLKKLCPQTWKLETAYTESNLTEAEVRYNNNIKEEREMKEDLKDFVPSQHVGSFFDEEIAEVIKTPIAGPVIKQPSKEFVSSVKDEGVSNFNAIPKIYETHKEFPYQIEDPLTKAKVHWIDESIDSKPTIEAPIKVPAGGLYKSPNAFKDKPISDEDFGLDINDNEKEIIVKKRANPWRDLLRLITAFIPAGLIISALTPSVITIHNVDNKRKPPGTLRRSNPSVVNLAPISEQCRRRLLCELSSDKYYISSSSKARLRTKHCYKIHCEDTEALWRTLRWLFTYNETEDDYKKTYIT